jgi:hypothetical protein
VNDCHGYYLAHFIQTDNANSRSFCLGMHLIWTLSFRASSVLQFESARIPQFAMKRCFLIAALLAPATLVCAQQSGDAPPSELKKLRDTYIASLNGMLQQYTKENNETAMAAVHQELARVLSPVPVALLNASPQGSGWFAKIVAPAPALTPETSPCGSWLWPGSGVKVINADGTIGPDHNQGFWHWLDRAARKLEIDWKEGWIDKLTISEDGQAMNCINNLGDEYSVRRLPPKNEHEAPESP